ncbi:MAG: EAL domain-containing protein [Pseudomonadota bacterium]|nr:EAL domain-containing protein [Pseudomonadota bacterium]
MIEFIGGGVLGGCLAMLLLYWRQRTPAGRTDSRKLSTAVGDNWRIDLPSGEIHYHCSTSNSESPSPCAGPKSLRALVRMVRESDQTLVQHQIDACARGATTELDLCFRLRGQDGRWVRARGQAIRAADGRIEALEGSSEDFTGRQTQLLQLQAQADGMQQLPDGLMVTDADFHIVSINQRLAEDLGVNRDDLVGQPSLQIYSTLHHARQVEEISAALQRDGEWQGEAWLRKHNGDSFPTWMRASVVSDAAGAASGWVALFSPVQEHNDVQLRLHHLAYYDSLTELPNRELFRDRLNMAIANAGRREEQLALLMLDLDRFKNINDTLGHTIGDQVLALVAELLHTTTRESDTVARIGDDEFSIIMQGLTQGQSVERVVGKILDCFSEPFVVDGHELFVTPSIGIALYPADGRDAEVLTKHAEAALYRAKDTGRNTYQFYAPDFGASFSRRLALEADLRKAMERNQLFLLYQPQVDVFTRRMTGIEALLRWQHPEQGLIRPDLFIPIAEETGLIVPIGEWVLRQGIQDVQGCEAATRAGLKLAINLSGRQLLRDGLVGQVSNLLRTHGFPAERLELELTETVLMENAAFTQRVLSELSALGVEIAIDDFGTGYSSLNYLSRFPIGKLKIDKSFVHNLLNDRNNAAIVSTIVSMGHNLGMCVVAEGVEEESQLAYLRDLSCDEAQGFLFSRPVELATIEELLRGGEFPISERGQ